MAKTPKTMDVLKKYGPLGVIVGLLLIGATTVFDIDIAMSEDLEDIGDVGIQTADMTTFGDATLFSAGKLYYIEGGAFNDTMTILTNRSTKGEDIISLDCTNGTGKNCVMILKK